MADTPAPEIPDDLIELKYRFLVLDAQQAQFVKTLPGSMDIATGKMQLTDEQRATLTAMQAELTELAVQIQRHPFLVALTPAPVDRYAADRAATKAARACTERSTPHPTARENL
ncbi:hypothetical protein ABH935_002657 [Catenulispora sp. GAS73]|uniref:hypothetical protein n=1 Tax=Catenulispora sp. GAS73 TaxID=3156269 RepID=UPI003516D57B